MEDVVKQEEQIEEVEQAEVEEVPVDAKGEPTGNVEVEPDKLPEAEPTAE